MALDEDALASELAKAEAEANKRRWRWDWINKPFTLWILTTIVIRIFSLAFTNYNACRAALKGDAGKFDRAFSELMFRGGRMYAVAFGLAYVRNFAHPRIANEVAKPPPPPPPPTTGLTRSSAANNRKQLKMSHTEEHTILTPPDNNVLLGPFSKFMNADDYYRFSEFKGKSPDDIVSARRMG